MFTKKERKLKQNSPFLFCIWAQMRTLIHFWLSLKVEIQLLNCYRQWQTCNQVGNLWQTCTPVWTVTDGPKHCKFTSQQATPMCLWIWPVTQSQPLKMQNISQTHRRSQQSVHTILQSLVFTFVQITYFVINSSWWEKLQKQWLCFLWRIWGGSFSGDLKAFL